MAVTARVTPVRKWLAKSEPKKYPWDQFVRDGLTAWDGVRNFEARNNLRAMTLGDLVLFYHSNEGKEIVGLARVARAAYADKTSSDDWSVVDLTPVCALPKPVSLAAIKSEKALSEMALIKRSRLSVVPVTEADFVCIMHMADCPL